MSKKKSIDSQPQYLLFKNRRLSNKAKEYQHEIYHLTIDIVNNNFRIQKTASDCIYILNIISKSKSTKHLPLSREDFICFSDLQYHLENLCFRINAYRDKVFIFLNFAFNLGFDEGEKNLYNLLMKNPTIKSYCVDTELKKFTNCVPLLDILGKRKQLSHQTYYSRSDYSPMLIPKTSPSVAGVETVGKEWRMNISKEIKMSDDATKKVLEINKKIYRKTINFLNRK